MADGQVLAWGSGDVFQEAAVIRLQLQGKVKGPYLVILLEDL
jgi:hypothetical protein